MDDIKTAMCGLANMGNTCYMNSIIQLFLHSKPIISFLRTKSTLAERSYAEYHKYAEEVVTCESIEEKAREKEKRIKKYGHDYGIDTSPSPYMLKKTIKDTVTFNIANIIDVMLKNRASVIHARKLKEAIDEKMEGFKGCQQHDGHEFLIGLLDVIFKETGIKSDHLIVGTPDYISRYEELTKIQSSCNDTLDKYEKILKKLLEQHEKNLLTHLATYRASIQYFRDIDKDFDKIEIFEKSEKEENSVVVEDICKRINDKKIELTIDLERTNREYMIHVSEYKTLIHKYNGLTFIKKSHEKKYNPLIFRLQTILVNNFVCEHCGNHIYNYEETVVMQLDITGTLMSSFDKFTDIEKIENYKCYVCSEKRTIKKYTKIWRAPLVMFIQLKRFSMDMHGNMRKITSSIEIPKTININPYCDLSTDNPDVKIDRIYKLKGISNHMGGLNGGHYTADCECIINDGVWYNHDDASVSRYNDDDDDEGFGSKKSEKISSNEAYILMYEYAL